MESTIPISEIFGPTIQGEGIHVGRRAVFIRTVGCDSSCPWCDTKYARGGGHRMTVAEIVLAVNERSYCKLVVLTGGNPVIHDCGGLVDVLRSTGREVHVETQGTVVPYWFQMVDLVTVCPKIQSDADFDRAKDVIQTTMLVVDVQLKYVVFDGDDYRRAKELSRAFPQVPMTIQPGYDCEWGTYPYGLAVLAEHVASDGDLHDGVRFLPQVHRLVWGDRRGV